MAGSYWIWEVEVNSKGSTTATNISSAILKCLYHGGKAPKNLHTCISGTPGMRRTISPLWGREIVYLLLVARPGQEAVAVVVVGFVLVVFVWFILRSLPRGVMIRPPQQKLRDEYHAPQFSALTSYAKLTFGCTSAHKKRD